jgi:hypothetical protein
MVQRWLRWYQADGDALVGEVQLHESDLPAFQGIVGAPPDDLLYDCWPVPLERLPELAVYGAVPVGSERFAYFLEAEEKASESDPP